MKPLRMFTVAPALPPQLEGLRELAFNLRWAWNHDTIELFRRLDSDLWESTYHNPVRMLGNIDQARLEAAVQDEGFMAHFRRVQADFQRYMSDPNTWFRRKYGQSETPALIAYFSFEFGLSECLSIFAGGLGILSGDHLKSASDLGLPLVGVGLLYQEGYFRQYLNQAGWQQEAYEDNDFDNLPLRLSRNAQGDPVQVRVSFPGRDITAQVWEVSVGRIKLYLLDTNIPENPRPEDRNITDQLYGGDQEMRIKQELLLGIGGYRALQALGLEPTIYHINEGHSAFLALEHTRMLMQRYHVNFWEAMEAASAGIIFTTHTPVPAGHDRFPPHLIERYFSDYMRSLGITRQEFFALGRANPYDEGEPFCMTILALNMAAFSNGVSRLHGAVSRAMWRDLWPRLPEDEIPIEHVTNGVHFESWISRDMKQLYDRYLGPRWREEPADHSVWKRAEQIAAEELWRTHERRRERMVSFVRRTLVEQLKRRGASKNEIALAAEVLDPEALTIGFARRFATYKRATLILRDPERLAVLLNDPKRPLQIIFAGKAHPRDDPGKELIRQIVELSRREEFRHRLVFIEDYDMNIARYLLQGVDVWLNTPRRPLEASGTSGMKAAANGVLNLSVLDGWWDEAYHPDLGWAIGQGETYSDPVYQDYVEAETLYNLLEQDVIPAFYERGRDGMPRRWIEMMKASLANLCFYFNTHRMVGEYTERYYMPAVRRSQHLQANSLERARALAQWKATIRAQWGNIRIEDVQVCEGTTQAWERALPEVQVGDLLCARVWVDLGLLKPEDVRVELCVGTVNADGELSDIETFPMHPVQTERKEGETPTGRCMFIVDAIPCRRSGLFGYTVRILPQHPDLVTPYLRGIILWA